jgi:nucleoside diphosphate kinase
MVLNSAFVFIKPHAVNDNVKKVVSAGLQEHGLSIVTEGTLSAEQIDKGMLIDKHYYAIASKATILKPAQLNVPAEKFKAKFGLGWQEALDKGVVYNAKDACEYFGLDAAGLDQHWAKAKKAKNLIKFGGGFYCGIIETVPDKAPIYVFNGFFMQMRSKYVQAGAAIHYYVVEWDSAKLSWEDFRGQALGPTDPADASPKSLRGTIYRDWQALGLASQPNVGDNGVHASASPFEALAERSNWLGASIVEDSFGKAALDAGISEKTLKEWSVDPQVTYGAASMRITASLFDSVEDVDSDVCLARLLMIQSTAAAPKKKKKGGCCGSSKVVKAAPAAPAAHSNPLHLAAAFVGGFALGSLVSKQFFK